MRCGEVTGDPEAFLELLVRMELCAIVEGDGLEEVRFRGNNPGYRRVGLAGGPVGNFSCSGQTGHPVYKGNDAFELVGSHHGVTFPMTELRTVFGGLGTLINGAFAPEPASGILCPVTLSSPFGHDPKLRVEVAATSAVPFDPSVNGRDTDLEVTGDGEHVGDLLWTPLES